ncbi:hypothetical protein Vadar_034388 [Vaccinium darrowii]|uniref:Uncharacterized protein n=1 Tax=Vaccinium darrowii TaxID=229202 RepID=A0ACB7YRI2_9ERIC|nr:hypothetical protein Vadar_034388 [Vaccinium darrowii]
MEQGEHLKHISFFCMDNVAVELYLVFIELNCRSFVVLMLTCTTFASSLKDSYNCRGEEKATVIIAASSGAMKADEVAKKALDGIKSGLSPRRSYLMAFVEVIAAGIVCIAALCFQWNWYGSIEK